MRSVDLIVAAALGLAAASCSGNPQADVVGKWLTPTGGSIEFKPDGTATMAGPNGAREVHYRLVDRRSIEISLPGAPAKLRWQIVSLGADELVIKDADGKEVRLRRGAGR